LAQYARQKKLERQPAPKRVFDNDNLPREEHISVVGNAKADDSPIRTTEETPAASAIGESDKSAASDQPKGDDASGPDKAVPSNGKLEVTPGQSADDRQKVYDQWKKRIADQKEAVDLASRELDVMQREYRLRAAAMYADAGNRLRNAGTWDKEDKTYKEQIEAKEKSVETAKQQLADLQEKARRAGVPAKDRD
jgi:hypothetical protein